MSSASKSRPKGKEPESQRLFLFSAAGIGAVFALYTFYKLWSAHSSDRNISRRGRSQIVSAQPAHSPSQPKEPAVPEEDVIESVRQSPNSLAKAHAVFSKLPFEVQTQYECAGWLGSGLTSTVVLAKLKQPTRRDPKSQTCALKIVSKTAFPSDSDDQHLLELVRQETRILCELQHPNVIKVQEWLETSQHIIIAMEHVGGGELYDNIVAHHTDGREGYTEETVRRMFRQMLQAIQYCHERGVIHRDIKPENILLSCGDLHSTNVKLCDFGLAKLFHSAMSRLQDGNSGTGAASEDVRPQQGQPYVPAPPPQPPSGRGSGLQLRRANTVCGSEHYHAPEISRGSYDAQCDLYSLGVVLYVMLSGELPDEDDILEASGVPDPSDVHYRQWCVGQQEHPVPETHASPALSAVSAAGSGLQRQDSVRSTVSTHSSAASVVFKPEALFRDRMWSMVSVPAKDLVARLLRIDPHWRINATQALAHPWMAAESWQDVMEGGRRVRHSRVLRSAHAPGSSPRRSPLHSAAAQAEALDTTFSLGASHTASGAASQERSLSQLPAPPQLRLQGSSIESMTQVGRSGAASGFSSDEDE